MIVVKRGDAILAPKYTHGLVYRIVLSCKKDPDIWWCLRFVFVFNGKIELTKESFRFPSKFTKNYTHLKFI